MTEDEGETLDLIATAGGFDIVPLGGGYKLVDRDTFNNWGIRPTLFRTQAWAEAHAWDCLNFKQGRLMAIADPITGYEGMT